MQIRMSRSFWRCSLAHDTIYHTNGSQTNYICRMHMGICVTHTFTTYFLFRTTVFICGNNTSIFVLCLMFGTIILMGVSECYSTTFTEMNWVYQLPGTLDDILELENRMQKQIIKVLKMSQLRVLKTPS